LITATTTFNNALNSNNRLWKIKVTVTRNDAGASPVDISDRVVSCNVDFDWNRRNGTARLVLDNYDYAISPLNKESSSNQVAGVYNPILDSNHIIEIYEGLITTVGTEYIKRFTGVLGDEIDADSYPGIVQVSCRDKSKLLQDTYIYQSKTYTPAGSGTLTLPEYVIQDLITTFLPSGGVTLSVVDPTNFIVGKPDQPYTAKDVTLWDAIQQISDAFSFCVMFDESGTLKMKKIVRDLGTVTPVYTFDESKVTKDSVSTNDADVRNHLMLRVQGMPIIEKKNDASIAKYGRRYMEVHRTLSYLITTAEQGNQLVDNILKDLSFVTPIDSLEMPLFPLIQVGDIVDVVNPKLGITASDYNYRVISVRDSFSKDKKRTSVEVQGYSTFTPASAPAPSPPTGLTASLLPRTVVNYPNSGWLGYQKTTYFPFLNWTPPVQNISGGALTNDFGGYTLYRKGPGDAGFYPIASVKSYIEASNLVINYFYDYTAAYGLNEYRITATNKYGQVSATGNTASIVKPPDLII
jgi:hypothetical protein